MRISDWSSDVCSSDLDALVQGVVGDEVPERIRRGRETAGNRDAEPGKLADHLAKRGILAADLGQVGQSKVVPPQDVFGGSEGAQDGHSGLCRRWRQTGKGRRSRPKLAILAARAGKRPTSGKPPHAAALAITPGNHGKTLSQHP